MYALNRKFGPYASSVSYSKPQLRCTMGTSADAWMDVVNVPMSGTVFTPNTFVISDRAGAGATDRGHMPCAVLEAAI